MKTLLNKIPTIPEIFKKYVAHNNLITAGDTVKPKKKNNIQNTIGDSKTEFATERLEKHLNQNIKSFR